MSSVRAREKAKSTRAGRRQGKKTARAAAVTTAGAVNGNMVAIALSYKGKVPYVTGGGSPRGWDCSGFVNYVLGARLGLTLPGGIKHFTGATHGPVVVSYVGWSGAVTVQAPAAGDIALWPGIGALGHMGIVVDANTLISALNPALGTNETSPIASTHSGKPTFRRVLGAGGGDISTVSDTLSGCLPGLILAPFIIARGILRNEDGNVPE